MVIPNRNFNSLSQEQDKFKYLIVSLAKQESKERDIETGYDYFEARFYDSSIGRFLQVDPMAEKGTWVTPYSSMHNNPINLVDIDGRWPWWIHHKLVNKAFSDDYIKNSKYSDKGEFFRNILRLSSDAADASPYQDSQFSFMHVMSDGSSSQTVLEAKEKLNNSINGKINSFNDENRSIGLKIKDFGFALHAIMDATSPEHADFKKWSKSSGIKYAFGLVTGNLFGESWATNTHFWGEAFINKDIQAYTMELMRLLLEYFEKNKSFDFDEFFKVANTISVNPQVEYSEESNVLIEGTRIPVTGRGRAYMQTEYR